jgi:nucleotide-binding universal stress UspA family protein
MTAPGQGTAGVLRQPLPVPFTKEHAVLPIQTILHPTDFSDHSDFAFRLACALARDYGARLVLLHVAAQPVIVYGEGVVPPDPEEYLEALKKKLFALEVLDPSVRAERRLKEGDPVTEILAEARETNADLVVMGTHGRTGLGRLLMGSVAEQVVRKASCPVLTVRTPFPEPVPSGATLAEAARA